MKRINYEDIYNKFQELRKESMDLVHAPGTKPTSPDLWSMATRLVLEENRHE